jgi:hypothetical protein
VIDDAAQSLLQSGRAEIDEKTQRQFQQAQIGQQLFGMNRREALNRFDLHDNPVLDQKIDAASFVEAQAVIFERDGDLPSGAQTAPLKIARQHPFIDGLQQSGAETGVQLVGCIDDRSRDLVQCSISACHSAPPRLRAH